MCSRSQRGSALEEQLLGLKDSMCTRSQRGSALEEPVDHTEQVDHTEHDVGPAAATSRASAFPPCKLRIWPTLQDLAPPQATAFGT
jgi:hypothetical protein